MPTVLTFLLRLLFVAAGLVFAASLAVAFTVMFAAWALRAGWARLTGRPVAPFVMRSYSRDAFGQVFRRPGQPSRTPRADAVAPRRETGEVTDVEGRPRDQGSA